jgi:glycosyltransferase involved in cell wall biosynthesis
MITTFYPPYSFGGDAAFVHRLSNELDRRGHHVEVIHCLDSYRLLARREPSGDYTDHPNVTVHGLQSRFGPLSPLATQQSGLPLLKSARILHILDQGFDVIHYHNVSLVGGPGILRYGQGIKLYTMHEYWLVCPTHVLFRFKREACRQPRCFPCGLVYKRPPQWWRHTRLLPTSVRHVDAFLAPSRFCKLTHHPMGLDVPIVHLPYFIPTPGESPRAAEESAAGPPQKPFFLFVGRLEKLKGLQTLIPVFLRYPRAELLIAGAGSYESRLKRLAGSSQQIHFLGHVTGQELQALYRRAVAIIAPSICFDVFPNVVLEAFRERTPAIVRNLGGMPEFIQDSGGGFTYDTREQLLEAMDQLLDNPSHRHDLGRRGYQALQQHWSAEAHLRRYFSLIDGIASGAHLGD